MNNEESLDVLMHACLVGRTDVLKVIGLAQFPCNHSLNICNHTSQNAMTALSSSSGKEPVNWFLSTPRSEDGATPLHVAAANSHSDVVRALLVS